MEKFIQEQTTGQYSTEFSNGITYRFYTMKDEWIAVVEMHPYQGMIPIIQAKDKSKALDYIVFIEPVNVPIQVLC